MPEVVVLDTNVLVSGFLMRTSVPGGCVELMRSQSRIAFSQETFFELQRVLLAKKFDRYVDVELRQEWLDVLEAIADFVEITDTLDVCSDPFDNMIVETAMVANAPLVVTGDKGLLALGEHGGVRVITPKAYVDLDF